MPNATDIATRNGLPRKLTAEQLVEIVRDAVTDGGRVTFRQHALDRMEQREVTAKQVYEVLRRGELIGGPTWSDDDGNWEFQMRAETAGDEVTVCAALEYARLMGITVVVITVFI